jgi:hypothetical protein
VCSNKPNELTGFTQHPFRPFSQINKINTEEVDFICRMILRALNNRSMKVAIMQPYFFPYVGYFSLIKHTDKFILFDPVQFIRHGWIERNRILKPAESWQYVAIPLEKHSRHTLIKDVVIRNNEDWRGKILRQLDHYKKAPFFKPTMEVVEQGIRIQSNSIVKVNQNALYAVCKYLHIPFNCEVFSEMNLEIEEVTHAGEWALNISKALGAKVYINPVGGKELFDQAQFIAAGIAIKFMGNDVLPYSQHRGVYEPGLSIIDVMMFNDVENVNRLIDAIHFI